MSMLSLLLPALVALQDPNLAPPPARRPAAPPPARAPRPADLDREAAGEDVFRHLSALIAIDTTNRAGAPAPEGSRPDGNELEAARYFESVLKDVPGVRTHVLESAPGRANFLAVLKAGEPTARPVLILGHLDVVGVDASRWETPPFQATVKEGYVHGRGAIDCKGPLAAELVAFLALAQRREKLHRNVVLLATAAEEGGPPLGVEWVLHNHRVLLGDPEFALNEGGRVRLGPEGVVASVNVQVTEKVGYDVRVSAKGPSGHGSVPLKDNALAALARAVERVHEARAPARLTDTTRVYFEKLATVEPDPALRAAMRRLVQSPPASDPFAKAASVLSMSPEYNALLRSAWSLTRLEGGFKNNVIPSAGTAIFNTRVLPGDDVREVVEAMRRVVNDPAVTIELEGEPREPPAPSSTDTALYRALEAAALEMVPGVVVTPYLSTGATDGDALRRAGIPTYGILPIPLRIEDEQRMHGDNERAPLEGLGWAAEYVFRVLIAVAG